MYVCRIGRSIWFDCYRIVMLFAVYNPHYYSNRIIAMIFVKHESRAVSSFNTHTHTQTADWLITSVRSHPNIYEYAFVLPHFSKPLPEFNVLVSWFHISNSNSFFGRSILLFSFSVLFVFAFVSLSLWFVLRSWQLLLDGCRCALHCNIYMLACYFYDR